MSKLFELQSDKMLVLAPSCVLKPDTLTSHSVFNIHKVVAPFQHDCKIVDLDVKPQIKQTKQ